MTPGMQIRLWYRRAPAQERRVTVTVFALVLVLLIGSIVFRPSPERANQLAAMNTPLGVSAPGDPAGASGSPAGSATTANSASTPTAATSSGGTTAGSSGGQTGANQARQV